MCGLPLTATKERDIAPCSEKCLPLGDIEIRF
jgi:hypothetical protein